MSAAYEGAGRGSSSSLGSRNGSPLPLARPPSPLEVLVWRP